MPTKRRAADDDVFLRYAGSAIVVALLADKWTIPVLHALGRGTKRTGELRRELVGVSQKMLTQTLRTLEAHGLVSRTVHPVVPPHVDYALTEMGVSINQPLTVLCEWVERNGLALERGLARQRRRARRAQG